MDGKCNGKGDIAMLTPVIVGSTYGLTSSVPFLDVHPKGLMTVTNSLCGVLSLEAGK